MNILFVTQGFPSEKNPMSGNYEAVQARAIASLGHHVSVISFRWKSLLHIFDRRPLYYRKSGNIDVYEMDAFLFRLPFMSRSYYTKQMMSWRNRLVARSFAKQYKNINQQPDIIHIHSLFMAWFSIDFKKVFNNVPVVLTEHWSGLNTDSIDKNLLSERKIYLLSDAVIVVSHALQNALKKYYGVDSNVIYNMVDDLFFDNKCRVKQDGIFTFISVGRFVPVKCFDSLIKAVSLMKQNMKFRLVLVGDGLERGKLMKMVEELKLQEKVQFTGLKSPDEVSSLLCDSDCFVLSSHRETFGIVLIEAMAKGLPVISTRCGGPEDIVNESNGLLVEPDNSEELAKAMDYMVEHAQDYDGDKIRQYCIDNFSQEKIGKKIIQVYENVQIRNPQ